MLKYTLCFIRAEVFGDDEVLFLVRKNPPNKGFYNGVGGKIKADETPPVGALREIREETGFDLDSVRFAGVVTWKDAPETGMSGMYVYMAEWTGRITRDNIRLFDSRATDEGHLRWMPVSWALDSPPGLLVSNIPHFLPRMLTGAPPLGYHCVYGADGELLVVTPYELSATVIALATQENATA